MPPQSPAVKSFLPDDHAPSRRAATKHVSDALRTTSPSRVRIRLRVLWTDASTPSGRREEVIAFGNPVRAMRLLRQLCEAPDRPVLSITVEAITRPRWETVPLDFLRWAAAQRERREAQRGGAR